MMTYDMGIDGSVRIGCLLIGPLILLLSACAGDLGDARQSAGKAAAFVGDMQQTTLGAVASQQAQHKNERLRIVELQVAGQTFMGITNQRRATWAGAGLKDPQELYKSMVELTSDADLAKTAPFVLMNPVPGLNVPEIDREKFTALIGKFNKLSEGLSPIDRAKALAPFIEVVVASYKDAVKASKNEKPLVAAKKTDVPTGTAALTTLVDVPKDASGAPQADGLQIETLDSNEVPANGLLGRLAGL